MLSGGRFLVTFVPGLARGPERDAVGVPTGRPRRGHRRAAARCCAGCGPGSAVTHDGPVGRFVDVSVSPLPVQDPFDVWLGGIARASLERCGRLADGWLPGLCTPDEAERGRQVVEEAAAAAGRTISPEHFGVSIGYARTALDDRVAAACRPGPRGGRSTSWCRSASTALRDLLERFIAVGFSKFVVRPLVPPTDWRRELDDLATAVGDLQT